MTVPKNPNLSLATPPSEPGGLPKLPSALKKLLVSTPEKDWPRLKAFLIESQEEGQIIDLLPEMNRVMKTCPARILSRVGRREISSDQLEKGWTQLYDSLHGVREAQHALLHLAGFADVRPQDGPGLAGKPGAPDSGGSAEAQAPRRPSAPSH